MQQRLRPSKGAIFFALLLLCGCQAEKFEHSNQNLQLSVERLDFDTVFSPLGSYTAKFVVRNTSSQNIIIQNIRLLKGDHSPFLININGQPQQADNMRLAKHDSLFVFVEVRKHEMFVLSDSVQFTMSDHVQYLPLEAHSRAAVVIPDTVFRQSVSFSNELPYLFLGGAIVAEGVEATVEEGCEMLFAYNHGLLVFGTLQVAGSTAHPVIFAHLRYRDPWYANESEQWQGISIAQTSEKNSSIISAVIVGATHSIRVEKMEAVEQAQLIVSRCAMFHARQHLQVSKARVRMDNTLLVDARQQAVLLNEAKAQLYFCTLTALDVRSEPLLQIKNSATTVVNSIVYGKNEHEIAVDNTSNIPYLFDHCLLKLSEDFLTEDVTHFQQIVRQDPLFGDAENYDFSPLQNSPARAWGKILYPDFPLDFVGTLRPHSEPPTLGVFE